MCWQWAHSHQSVSPNIFFWFSYQKLFAQGPDCECIGAKPTASLVSKKGPDCECIGKTQVILSFFKLLNELKMQNFDFHWKVPQTSKIAKSENMQDAYRFFVLEIECCSRYAERSQFTLAGHRRLRTQISICAMFHLFCTHAWLRAFFLYDALRQSSRWLH